MPRKRENKNANAMPPKRPFPTLWSLIVLGGLSICIQYVTLAKFSEKNTAFELSLPHSPIVVSPRVVRYNAEAAAEHAGQIRADSSVDSLFARSISQVLWVIEQMGIRHTDNSCERVFIRGDGDSDLRTTPTAQVISHVVKHHQVKMKVAVSENCYARLSYAYFPFLQITVDGTPVHPMETAGRFIALPLEAGERDIVIQARLSPLRKGLLAFKAILLSIALGLVFIEQKRVRSAKKKRAISPALLLGNCEALVDERA